MSDSGKNDDKRARTERAHDRSAQAQRPGGNPDKKPSANAGNVGLGGANET